MRTTDPLPELTQTHLAKKHPCIATTSRGTAPRSTAVHLITPHLPRALCRFRPHLPRILAVTIATPSQRALRTQARGAANRSRRRRGIRRRASREGNGVRGRGFGEVETEFGKTEREKQENVASRRGAEIVGSSFGVPRDVRTETGNTQYCNSEYVY